MRAQIKVGQELVKPKAIHLFKDGEWQEKRVGYVFIKGEWISFIQYAEYLYNRGMEFLIFERINMGGTFLKNVDHYLCHQSTHQRSSVVPVLSNKTVDLSSYNKLFLKHEPTEAGGLAYLQIFASLNKTHTSPAVVSRVNFTAMKLNETNVMEIDVSNLSGFYFIGFALNTTNADYEKGTTKIYEIYLE